MIEDVRSIDSYSAAEHSAYWLGHGGPVCFRDVFTCKTEGFNSACVVFLLRSLS